MYTKIVTLLALVFGGFGAATTAQSAIRDHARFDRPVESVRVTDVNERNEREDGQEDPTFEPIVGCHVTDGTINPEAEALANELGLSYESILQWFCAGYAEPAIQIAYEMSVMAEVSLDEIFQMLKDGLTWSQILRDLGLPTSHSFWVTGVPGGEPEDAEGPTRPER